MNHFREPLARTPDTNQVEDLCGVQRSTLAQKLPGLQEDGGMLVFLFFRWPKNSPLPEVPRGLRENCLT